MKKITKIEKIQAIAEVWTDAMTLDDLRDFYQDREEDELEKLSDAELDAAYRQNVLNEDPTEEVSK